MTERARFFDTLRRSLGREPEAAPPEPAPETALSRQAADVRANAERIRELARDDSGALANELVRAAETAGWRVAVCESHEDAARYVAALAREIEAGSVVRSGHSVIERLGIERELEGSGIEVRTMALDADDDNERNDQRKANRERMIGAGIGLTGVDYAIAETGSCAIIARQGASRLVSLLPPVHVAVVEMGQVLPSLDELFALLRERYGEGDFESYMNIITGPSRSADIEYQLVTGVHGPGEVHMVIVG